MKNLILLIHQASSIHKRGARAKKRQNGKPKFLNLLILEQLKKLFYRTPLNKFSDVL